MLLETCARLGIAPAQAIAVGDGANDLPMMGEAGLSVAYHAKPDGARAGDGGDRRAAASTALLEVVRALELRSAASADAQAGVAAASAQHDDAVVVGVEPVARADPHALHLHRDVALPLAALVGRQRHSARARMPTRVGGELGRRRARSRRRRRRPSRSCAAAAATLPPTSARRSEPPPSTTRTRPTRPKASRRARLVERLPDERVVLEALQRRHRPGERGHAAVAAKQPAAGRGRRRCVSALCASHRSQVAKSSGLRMVMRSPPCWSRSSPLGGVTSLRARSACRAAGRGRRHRAARAGRRRARVR